MSAMARSSLLKGVCLQLKTFDRVFFFMCNLQQK